MATRSEVYKAIDTERNYQQEMTKINGWDNTHSVGEFLTLLAEYVRRGQNAWCSNTGEEPALNFVRKIAGISVACMEQNGAPARV